MIRYVYDGSYDGFLCAVDRVIRERGNAQPDCTIAPLTQAQGELFTQDVPVVTDAGAARALRNRLSGILGDEEAGTLALAQASSDTRAPDLLLRYMMQTLRSGSSISEDISRPEVLAVRKVVDRVYLEIHKLMGFVRFSLTADGLYYAAVEPDSNIVGFIGPHFADRFKDQAFLIHDLKRGIAFWHDSRGGVSQSGIAELPAPPPDAPAPGGGELDRVQDLWKEYFKKIAIPQRRNPALQARNMPKRYWKHLTEVQDKVKGK